MAEHLDKVGLASYDKKIKAFFLAHIEAVREECSKVPTITMKESAWNEIADDPNKLSAFCKEYEGYILNVTEDYIDIDLDNKFRFGGKFPIVFSNN